MAKSGSGLANIVSSASYPSSCTTAATCNQPTTTTDPLGNVTDYAYDSTTGLVTSVKAPAPTTGAVRPETRYSYTALQAYYSNGTSIVASGQPVTLLTGISTCQTTSSCSATSDEVVTTISYGPQTTGVGNNLQPVSVTTGAGDGTLIAPVSLTYDAVGNLISVDGPLAGTADTTTYRYDADRERVGVISPDPDGAGSLKRRAVKTTFNSQGIATLAELGTVNGTSDTDWAAFTSLQQQALTLDAADRPVVTALTAGGATYQVSQKSYDAAGRLECTALRMNSATWGALPSSACAPATTGSYGPDRISKATYNAAGQVTKLQTAYGTSAQADEVTGAYNSNGTVASLTDAEGNKTSYVYDGFDRLLQTFYPVTTVGAGTSSSSDYEQLSYDAGSEVTARRVRDGNWIAYGYDHLGRLTYKDLPGTEPDVAYVYDNLGRLTLAIDAASKYAGFGYDALGRATAQSSDMGIVGMGYDLAGRRTLTVWPGSDGFFVTYEYDAAGNMTTVREKGTAVLATYAYDDLGRRTGVTRGNGTTSTYGYDNVSRLASLGLNLDGTGTANDLAVGFGYSPAGQIASMTRSNNGFAWAGAANRNDASSINGLNQVTSVGTGSMGYDAKGNLTGTNSFAYSSENLLLEGPLSAALAYDPLLRLYRETSSFVAATRFQYDGQALIGEYNDDKNDTVPLKRYVMGAGTDAPLVEYDKSGGGFTRVWLHADERGSIVAQSNDSGTTTAINSYDEYGVPASSNVGRFQYTGQTWLPSVGVYNYKARLYSPRLGRFMQTDPIGYAAGTNWYTYAGVDPINFFDSSGRDRYCINPEAQTGCFDFIEVRGNPYAPPPPPPVFTNPSPDLSGGMSGTGSGLGESEPVIPDVVVVARQHRYEVVIPVPPPTARKPYILVIPVPPPTPRRIQQEASRRAQQEASDHDFNCAVAAMEETGGDVEMDGGTIGGFLDAPLGGLTIVEGIIDKWGGKMNKWLYSCK